MEEYEDRPAHAREIEPEVDPQWFDATPFRACLGLSGVPALLWVGWTHFRVTDREHRGRVLRELELRHIKEWSATAETFTLQPEGKPAMEFVLPEDAVRFYRIMSSRLNTVEIRGVAGQVKPGVEEGGSYTVSKAPLGTPATVEFQAERLVVTA